MTVMLLTCSKSLLYGQIASSKPLTSSTGEVMKSDTSKVIIPISFLRDANAKLLERLYLIKVVEQKDSIISLANQYTTEQNNIIKDFQGRVVTLTNTNNKLVTSIDRQKKTTAIFGSVALGAIVGVIVVIFAK